MSTIDGEAKALRARELYLEGYNCAQSVFGAYAEECGLELKTALRIAGGFGGGIGGMRGICGALSGAFMTLGILRGYEDADDYDTKKMLYALEQGFAARFGEEFGSIRCADLLEKNKVFLSSVPAERTPEYYRTRPCARYIEWCAKVVADVVNEG